MAAAGLGTRRQRVALVADRVLHGAAGAAELVSVDSFYIGHLKGVGKMYQLTAVDVFTRWATVAIIVSTPTGGVTARFVAALVRHWRRHGHRVRAVITDHGPEYRGADFRAALAERAIRHVRIPSRSPNHNAVVERFHGTMLQECWRPAFQRRRFTSRRELQAAAQAWLVTYNRHRRNHGDCMRGRTHTKSSLNNPPK